MRLWTGVLLAGEPWLANSRGHNGFMAREADRARVAFEMMSSRRQAGTLDASACGRVATGSATVAGLQSRLRCDELWAKLSPAAIVVRVNDWGVMTNSQHAMAQVHTRLEATQAEARQASNEGRGQVSHTSQHAHRLNPSTIKQNRATVSSKLWLGAKGLLPHVPGKPENVMKNVGSRHSEAV